MFLLLFSTKCVTDVQNCSFDNRIHFKSIKLHTQNGILALLMSDGRNSVFINVSPYFMFFKVTSWFYWVLCPYMVDVWTRGSKRWILWFEMEPFALFRVMSRQGDREKHSLRFKTWWTANMFEVSEWVQKMPINSSYWPWNSILHYCY